MYSYNEILRRMLDSVSGTLDKRQGSIIFDSLAPSAAELAQAHIVAQIFEEQIYILTATGNNLDKGAANHGLYRKEATKAIRIGLMLDSENKPFLPPIGSRFSTPNIAEPVNFTLIAGYSGGQCLLESEALGTIGNRYQGSLLPLFVINNLSSASIVGTQKPGEDTETDNSLRDRVIERINRRSYGGNISDYKEFTTDIDGVGSVKVFPIWDGGGTVKLSILDTEYNPATLEFIELVQTKIDPIPNNGQGLGIAPIGHRVTVETPTEVSIYITAKVVLKVGYTIPQIQASVNSAINEYLLNLRKDWANSTQLSVFIARVNATIIGIEGVDNVFDILINNSPADLQLIQTPQTQQIPIFGSVILQNG